MIQWNLDEVASCLNIKPRMRDDVAEFQLDFPGGYALLTIGLNEGIAHFECKDSRTHVGGTIKCDRITILKSSEDSVSVLMLWGRHERIAIHFNSNVPDSPFTVNFIGEGIGLGS